VTYTLCKTLEMTIDYEFKKTETDLRNITHNINNMWRCK